MNRILHYDVWVQKECQSKSKQELLHTHTYTHTPTFQLCKEYKGRTGSQWILHPLTLWKSAHSVCNAELPRLLSQGPPSHKHPRYTHALVPTWHLVVTLGTWNKWELQKNTGGERECHILKKLAAEKAIAVTEDLGYQLLFVLVFFLFLVWGFVLVFFFFNSSMGSRL